MIVYPPDAVPYVLQGGHRIPDLHPDDVAEVLAVYETYEATLTREDAMAHALAAFRACRERRMIAERAAEHRREAAHRVVASGSLR